MENKQYYRSLAQVALDAIDKFDWSHDCTCGDGPVKDDCWYSLEPEVQQAERLDYIASELEAEDDRVYIRKQR